VLLWLIFACLTAAVLFMVLSPLARPKANDAPRAAFDASVYRDQLAEIEGDRERGLIGEAEAEAARIEIARRLLALDAVEASGQETGRAASAKTVMIGVAACLPLLALGLYLVYGSPNLPDQPLAARLQDPASSDNLQALVARVEARLRAHPEEGEGWEVIAPVYMAWRRYNDAADAYAQTIRLLGESAQRLSGRGRALVLANNGVVTEEARTALDKAANLDPDLIEPRVLLAMAKEQDGQFKEAAEDWRGLLAKDQGGAPWRQMVGQRLAQAEARAAGKPLPESSEGTQAQRQGGPTSEDIAAAERLTPAGRQAMVERMVQRLAARLDQNGDDLPGWLKLVRAYSVLDRTDDAKKALARAKSQFSADPQAIGRLDALADELGLKS
jgi:cytochrome c-type biogenesis protein CcmH